VNFCLDRIFRWPQSARQNPKCKCDVLEDRHVPEKRVVLEHEPDLAVAHAQRASVVPEKLHRSTARSFKSADNA
jgi:hypothetical protein